MIRLLLPCLLFFSVAGMLCANPEPDIPVHCSFAADGTAAVTVEVDPRCFTAEPMLERYFMKVDLTASTAQELEAVKQQVRDVLPRWLRFETEPAAALLPQWQLRFTGIGGADLVKADDPVVVRAEWRLRLPAGVRRWRVAAAREGRFSVIVKTRTGGVEQPRAATLFPGEASRWLELPVQHGAVR